MEPKIGLTPRQAEVLHFIKVFFNEYGYYPTVREICGGKVAGEKIIKPMSAHTNAHRLLNCLHNKGYIIKAVASPRGIAIVK
jgi:SOS-response transcriptional repressor LexA|tara:strand:+ start:2476 stop:2721 length:246 start_codon:yes stop_codon:yes gene_type:complete